EFHILTGIDDALGPIEYRNECDRSRKTRADLGKERLDRVRNLDRVCARLARDGQHHDGAGRTKTAHPKCAGESLVLHALANLGHVAQIHGRAISVTRDNQIAVSFRLIDLPVWEKNKCTVRPVELSGASV